MSSYNQNVDKAHGARPPAHRGHCNLCRQQRAARDNCALGPSPPTHPLFGRVRRAFTRGDRDRERNATGRDETGGRERD
ncbi:hypothetical protein EVAR_78336_1 [Eumeta japonica]|uniref:Uncharacterized protein n=1 Tax=Eumeta variegata TaxID=151549 RepID=A0A4C1T448_EUMVA|nr:hypothetical protein EVAR_78336_1 [Eumeta japonica]